MSRSSRKHAQKEAAERARRQRLESIRNPDLPPDELEAFHATCDEMYSVLDALARDASVTAKLANNANTPVSHVGGAMLLESNNDWPTGSNGPLSGVLEVYVKEPPHVPPTLSGYQLLQLFLEVETDGDTNRYRDGDWTVLLQANTSSLGRYSNGAILNHQPLAFSHERSTPAYPDDLDVVDDGIRDRFEELPNWSELLADRYPSAGGVRYGGWPQWIDGQGVGGEFVFQVEGWYVGLDLGFDGTLYFGFDPADSTWHCTWEIG